MMSSSGSSLFLREAIAAFGVLNKVFAVKQYQERLFYAALRPRRGGVEHRGGPNVSCFGKMRTEPKG
jgi:hypothetical protein